MNDSPFFQRNSFGGLPAGHAVGQARLTSVGQARLTSSRTGAQGNVTIDSIGNHLSCGNLLKALSSIISVANTRSDI